MGNNRIETFVASEDGGAAFDWKTLTALVAGMGIAAGILVYDGTETPTQDISATLSDESLPDQIFPGRAYD